MPTLDFKGKTAVATYHHTVPHHTFEFDRKLSVLPKGESPSLDGNLIIEGDNLLALKALLPTHAGKVKCIYIDPPYNTGNEGWVYNDNLTQPQFKEWINKEVGKEGEDFCRHDKWCCMMYPRFKLIEQLLADEGFFFISIDDIELSNLLAMMESDIFARSRFVACMIWKSRQYPDARAKTGVSTDHEYIVVYSKSADCRLRGGDRDETKYSNPDNDDRGPWMSRSMLGLATAAQRPNLHYPLVDPATNRSFDPPADTGWRYERRTMKTKIEEGRILFPAKATGRPREKVFLRELVTKYPGLPSIIDHVFTADGTKEIREIFGEPVFQFPKPSELVRLLIEQATQPDDLVLDCTAGSGTTAHAVLKLNASDESNRRFVLVQQPHDTGEQKKSKFNVCRQVTRERVHRVITGKWASGPAARLGGSFTYARLSAKPLFGDYRDLGKKLPSFDDIAAYIFYTETSVQWPGSDRRKNKAFDAKTGRIGDHGGASYYLLYSPNDKLDAGLDAEFLKHVAAKDPNPRLVVYAERIWAHRDQLRAWEREHGKRIRPMVVPFNLK